MEFGSQGLLVAAVLLLAAILAQLVSQRFGAPILFVFMLVGMLAGEDGPGGIHFDNPELTVLAGSAALAVILFDGGFRTPMSALRAAWAPALSLATVGVIVTAVVVGAVARLFFDDWRVAMLVGSIVASTDAAAVFALLGQRGIGMRERLRATLEIESGANDPMGVFMTVLFAEMIRQGVATLAWSVLLHFGLQMGLGVAVGVAGGYALSYAVNRLELSAGLYPILTVAGALLVFAGTQEIGGSGFLAVYVAGLVFGNRRVRARQLVGRFFDALAWLGQIGLFLILGLLVTPTSLANELPMSLTIAATLIVLARPLAVAVTLAPFGFTLREQAFVAWVGLRGAVPIFLALLPYMAGIDSRHVYFHVAFVVVLVSLAIQGWTIPFAARWLRVELPPEPEPAPRLDVDLIHQMDRDLIAYEVKPHSRATDWTLADLRLPERTRIVSVLRGDAVLEPEGLERLQAGDVALVLTPPEHNLALDRWFSRRFASTAVELRPEAGDFVIDGTRSMAELYQTYAIAGPAGETHLTLDQAMRRRLGTTVGRGDRVRIGAVEFVVLDLIGGEITRVGLILDPPAHRWRALLARLGRTARRQLRRDAASPPSNPERGV